MTARNPDRDDALIGPEFADLPVVCCTAQTFDQVAAMVAGHDGASRAEISLEGTNFRVTLGPRRPLVYKFSERDKCKWSETERAKLLAKWDRDQFVSARDWAVRKLRALSKSMCHKVHPPRKMTPVAGEADQLRRQLEEARRDLGIAHDRARGADQEIERLRGRLHELERKLEKAAEKFDRQATRMAELDQALVDKSLELGSFHLLLKDPRMAFVRDHLPELPLEALQWIVEQETAT